MRKTRILHVLRAPLGGLFRHVSDLAEAQHDAGLDVGIICDSGGGSRAAEATLEQLHDRLTLGVFRTPMSRNIGWRDLSAYREVRRLAHDLNVEVLHGHGAKGGAFARLAGRALRRMGREVRVFYTPHGGSLHYRRTRPSGLLYLDLERRLAPHTDGLIFESAFGARAFASKVGRAPVAMRVIPNGLHAGEFYETLVADNAADFLFIGELRRLKGVDVLLDAVAIIAARREVTLSIVGEGPDEARFRRQAKRLRLGRAVDFVGARPARVAFTRGRCLVAPSRAESFPYVVLEAGAARLPVIASDVGGVPEIAGPFTEMLVEPANPAALAQKLDEFLTDPIPFVERAQMLQSRIRETFSVEAMAREVDDFYTCDLTAQPRL